MYKVLDYCKARRSYADVEAQIAKYPEFKYVDQSQASIIEILVHAGALKKSSWISRTKKWTMRVGMVFPMTSLMNSVVIRIGDDRCRRSRYWGMAPNDRPVPPCSRNPPNALGCIARFFAYVNVLRRSRKSSRFSMACRRWPRSIKSHLCLCFQVRLSPSWKVRVVLFGMMHGF